MAKRSDDRLPTTCAQVKREGPAGQLALSTEPAAVDELDPGEAVKMTLDWDDESFVGDVLHKALACVYVNGRLAPELSGEDERPPNTGRFRYDFTVPTELPEGSKVCLRGLVSGQGSHARFERKQSAGTCFTVVGPPGVPGGGKGRGPHAGGPGSPGGPSGATGHPGGPGGGAGGGGPG